MLSEVDVWRHEGRTQLPESCRRLLPACRPVCPRSVLRVPARVAHRHTHVENFVHMPVCQGHKYVPVILDQFSKWVEVPELLPIMLSYSRNTPNAMAGLGPHEV